MLMRRLLTLVSVSDPELLAWLRGGLDKYRGGEELGRALGISGPTAIEARNEAIRSAVRLTDPDGGMSDWGKARLLAQYLDGSLSARGNQQLKEALRVVGKESKYSQGLRSVRRIYDVLKVKETTDLLDLMPAPPEETERDDEHDKQIKLSI